MNYTAIFQGGGLKSIAYIGAILALEEEGFICKKAAGVSAGAIFATLLMAGYTGKEMINIINNLNIETLIKKNDNFIKNTINDKGMYSLYYIEKMLEDLLIRKGKYTFLSFKEDNLYKLRILATNKSKNVPIVFPDNLIFYNINPDYFSVAKAVVMSSTFPVFFKPLKINNDYIVDGGIIDNFPYKLFNYNNDELIIGFLLTSKKIKNMSNKIKLINLDTKGIKMLNFKIKKEDQFKLIEKAYLDTKKQLRELDLI